MNEIRATRAVFAGCARDCAPFLEPVLGNIERCAGLFREAAFVFAENDSADETRTILERWTRARPQGTLLHLDGLAAREGVRPARIAVARNACMKTIEDGPLRGFDHLIVFDLDEVNAGEISIDAFSAALDFLERDSTRAAAFACSDPAYFDVWALRHQEWCPRDCWAEVLAEKKIGYAQAVEKYVYKRQRTIAPTEAPIQVLSAFGGLGIYRLATTLNARYAGRTSDGNQTCEHVSFNESVSRSGDLFIFPALRNHAPPGHLRPRTGQTAL